MTKVNVFSQAMSRLQLAGEPLFMRVNRAHKLAGCIALCASMTPLAATASTAFTSTWPPAPVTSISACVASGVGTDYQVGPGKQYTTLDQVPWEKLAPGDTVRIFYSSTPYRGKMLIPVAGTISKPIRVCGVKDSLGNRPIIDGQNAVARKGLSYVAASLNNIQEARAIIMIDRLGTSQFDAAAPSYIQIDGLELRNANPSYTFTNSAGGTQSYESFGACLWINRGHHIIVADNIMHDCTNGIYSQSTNDSYPPTYVGDDQFAVTRNIQIIGNYIYNNGNVGEDGKHNAYIQSINVVYEFNHFGAPRSGALGNAIKDRSAGTIVRYNRIEEGAHALDLVETEDGIYAALAEPNSAYRYAYVYGNQIIKSGNTGSVIHYGGDHYGASSPTDSWGEPHYRQGTLYFWNNTVYATGSGVQLFQLSTTLEKAQVWNNVFASASSITYTGLRASSDVNTTYWTTGGTMTLGVNWINSNYGTNSDPWHTIPGTVSGTSNLITGSTLPVSVASTSASSTLMPTSSAVIGKSQTQLAAELLSVVSSYALKFQLAGLGSGAYVPLGFNVSSSFDLGGMQSNAAFPPSPPPAVSAAVIK